MGVNVIFKVKGIDKEFIVFIICFDIFFGVIFIVLVFEYELVDVIISIE